MKIDQLPVEILIKIFSYLPTYGEVSLVNKRFYDTACKVNDSNICLRIDQQFCKRFFSNNVSSNQLLRSILTSNRQITTVKIVCSDDDYLVIRDQRRIISVVDKFSVTITSLQFSNVTTDELTFLEILSLTPNIKRLDLQQICTEQQSLKRRRRNDDLNLKKLKSLRIVGCSDDLIRNFNRLPVEVLLDLQINCRWNTLAVVLNRQFNIKNLVYIQDGYDDDQHATDIFDNLILDSLVLHLNSVESVTIEAILSKQMKLKSLIFNREAVVNERIMDAVAKLSELEILSMNVTGTRTASLAKIRRLKKLQDLKLQCADNDGTSKIKVFAESANISMKKLSLEFGLRIPVDLVGAVAKSTPDLTHLNVILSNFFKSTDLDAILCHFNCLEVLQVSIWSHPLLNPGNYFNAKLKQLSIFVPYADAFYKLWLTKLTGSYPNLQKFHLIARYPDTRFKIRPILNGFTKLESLTLESSQMILEDLDYLHDRKINLKFVSLGRLEKATLTDELVKKLRANFDVVKVDRDRVLNAAVGRHTINM